MIFSALLRVTNLESFSMGGAGDENGLLAIFGSLLLGVEIETDGVQRQCYSDERQQKTKGDRKCDQEQDHILK